MIRLKCQPGTEAATLTIQLNTSSPTLSLSALKSSTEPIIRLQIHIRIAKSVHPSRPITFCTQGTIFDTAHPTSGHMDTLALGKLGPGLVCTHANGQRKVISLGNFRVHRARQDGDNATNLAERPDTHFVSVPSLDSGGDLVLTHEITSGRLFAHAEGITREDLQVGEKYEMGTSERHLGTMWWCWGDLDGDLEGIKLHCFSEGFCVAGEVERPGAEEVEREGWVTGQDVSRLVFGFGAWGRGCGITVVE